MTPQDDLDIERAASEGMVDRDTSHPENTEPIPEIKRAQAHYGSMLAEAHEHPPGCQCAEHADAAFRKAMAAVRADREQEGLIRPESLEAAAKADCIELWEELSDDEREIACFRIRKAIEAWCKAEGIQVRTCEEMDASEIHHLDLNDLYNPDKLEIRLRVGTRVLSRMVPSFGIGGEVVGWDEDLKQPVIRWDPPWATIGLECCEPGEYEIVTLDRVPLLSPSAAGLIADILEEELDAVGNGERSLRSPNIVDRLEKIVRALRASDRVDTLDSEIKAMQESDESLRDRRDDLRKDAEEDTAIEAEELAESYGGERDV